MTTKLFLTCSLSLIGAQAIPLYILSVMAFQKTQEPDMAAIKAEIQALEEASSDKDAAVMLAFYANDTITLRGESKGIVGKAMCIGKHVTLWEKRKGQWLIVREVCKADEKGKCLP